MKSMVMTLCRYLDIYKHKETILWRRRCVRPCARRFHRGIV